MPFVDRALATVDASLFKLSSSTESCRLQFCAEAFAALGLDWERYVVTDPAFIRPAEADLLLGDATKARTKLGWVPRVGFPELVRRMVAADLALVSARRVAP